MKVRYPIPRDKGMDNTLSLINEGFNYISDRREELQSDIFETRLLGKKAICMAGEEAAEIFYDDEKFTRKGAVPKPLKKTLLGENTIHEQEGEVHKQRKRMHLSMMTPERLEDMKRIAIEELNIKATQWENKEQVILFEEMHEILTRAGCRWAGIPLKEEEVKQRTDELVAVVDSFGGSLSRYKKAKKARESQEKWLSGIIKDIRKGRYSPPAYTPAYIVAHHREINGKKLDLNTAAVELSNSFRPLIATANFIAFGALALHEHPEKAVKLREDDGKYMQMFAQEVRRYYPFAPAMGAKVKRSFIWKDYKFKKNTMVVLDFFGTNRHPDSWEKGEEFKPERFENWNESPFSFIPQGGGDHHTGHRCAGEWMTVMVMRSFFKYLTANISYQVPEQDLSYSMTRMPTMPKSGFVLTNVKKNKPYPKDLLQHEQSQTVVKS